MAPTLHNDTGCVSKCNRTHNAKQNSSRYKQIYYICILFDFLCFLVTLMAAVNSGENSGLPKCKIQ